MIRSGEYAIWDAHLAKVGALHNLSKSSVTIATAMERAGNDLARAFRDAIPMLAEALRRMS